MFKERFSAVNTFFLSRVIALKTEVLFCIRFHRRVAYCYLELHWDFSCVIDPKNWSCLLLLSTRSSILPNNSREVIFLTNECIKHQSYINLRVASWFKWIFVALLSFLKMKECFHARMTWDTLDKPSEMNLNKVFLSQNPSRLLNIM